MKHINYLSTISILLIFSCCTTSTGSKSIIDEHKISNKKTAIADTVSQSNEFIDDKVTDTVINKVEIEKKDDRKVIIDGKAYYKKNATDFRIENTYVYRTKDKRFDYDIRSGAFLPSGNHAGAVKTPIQNK